MDLPKRAIILLSIAATFYLAQQPTEPWWTPVGMAAITATLFTLAVLIYIEEQQSPRI